MINMGNCDLPEVPKYIAEFIKDTHRFNEDIKTKGENYEKTN